LRILGISAFYHDSAAALVEDGGIVAAAQEERFTRIKQDSGFPRHAVDYCLAEAGATLGEVDFIAFYDKPFLKFERLLETYVACAPMGFESFRMAMPVWLKEKLFQKSLLSDRLKAHAPDYAWDNRLLFTEHHQSHAASAFYPSPFERAAILTMDGVGEWTTTSLGLGAGNRLEMVKEIHFPHSLGLLYSAFTYYTGFKVNSGEYKVMGLAPYGEPKYAQTILDNVIDVKEDGSFRLDMSYFDFCTGLRMTSDKFHALFGAPRPFDREGDRREEPLPRRRGRAQLRRQRQAAARRRLRPYLGPARGGRCRRRAGRGAGRLSPLSGTAAHAERPHGRDEGILSRPLVRPGGDRAPAHREEGDLRRPVRRRDAGPHGAGAGRRQGGRLVPGADGVRPPRAGRPLDPRRSAGCGDAEDAEPACEVPRKLPPLRAVGAARMRLGLVRH
jgi:hypothetical protein